MVASFSIIGGNGKEQQAYVTGDKGKYDGVVQNPAVRYSRNAIENFIKYKEQVVSQKAPTMTLPNLRNLDKLSDEEFDKTIAELDAAIQKSHDAIVAMAPLDYTLKYLPGTVNPENIDTAALLGAAYEEMGKNTSIETSVLTRQLQRTFNTDNISAEPLDLDSNGKIDIAEYASSILVTDMLSDGSLDKKDIDGKINNKGHQKLLGFFDKYNNPEAQKVLRDLHISFSLDKAKEEFVKNPNNVAK